MKSAASCPPADALRLLLLGRLDGPEAERWLLHLDTCPACLEAARGLAADDPVVEALRRQKEPTLPAARAAGVPETLPGFELLGEIGRGGMGVVERARQVRLGRLVAIKRIRGGAAAGPGQHARFHAEAAAVA